MDTTENLDLPYILPSQAQKHVTHNEALRMLDALVQAAVTTRGLSAPPIAPAAGARYIVADGATGVWTGQEGKLAAWQDGGWSFYPPLVGWLAYVSDEERLLVFTDEGWRVATADAAPPDRLGINMTAEAPNRLALAGAASLFNHEGAGHQLKINKAGSGDTASLIFQTGHSGRAEFGLAGDDDFHVKVSADGSSWTDAMVVDRTSGRSTFPAGIAGVREQLAADRTYYVDPAGSDANDGLSAGAPFATVQKAVDEACRLDCSIHDVTIRLADGIYGGQAVSITRPLLGGGTLSFVGDEATPANVVVPGFSVRAGWVSIGGMKIATGTDWINSILVQNGAVVTTGALEFGAIGANACHISVASGGIVTIGADYAISGGAARHLLARGGTIDASSRTVTLTGTPAFTSFAFSSGCGSINLWNPTFAGAATGQRYVIDTNGVLNTYGKPADFLPGDAAGTATNGGVYV